MHFNWRQFLIDGTRALLGREPHLRIDGHRARVLAMFFFCMAWMGGSGRIGLFLDRFLFPQSTRTPVNQPLFIIGNFRSGSTLLHRLLAADPQFTAMKTWEIYFAPSVTQRRFWHGLFIVDGWFGSPVKKRIRAAEARRFGEVTMHRVKLDEPEEDEALLLYLWESLFNWFFMPYRASENPYWRFDAALPRWRRRAAMRFYRGCLMRHLYAHGGSNRGGLRYVSKNPSFSAKLDSLLEEFPDARIVYLVRHPADTLVSTVGWFSFAWHYFASPDDAYPFLGTLMEMVRDWYTTPLARLQALSSSQYRIVRYEDLVDSPQKTVTDLLSHFGMTPAASTHQHLNDLENGPPVNRSHRIELETIGLSPHEFARFFAEPLDRFGYKP